jgi:transposase
LLRKVVKDSQWERIAPSLPASPGTPDDRRPTTDSSAKPCSGSPARVHPGAIFPPIRALESCRPALPPPDFKGRVRRSLRGSYPVTRISNTRSSRSSWSPNTAPAQKGGPHPKPARRTRDLTTKMQCDVLGNLAGFVLPPGQRHASVGVAPWIESHATLCEATRPSPMIGGAPAPSSRRRPAVPARFPAIWTSPNGLSKWRHLEMASSPEHFFCDRNQFRRIATRYEKTDESDPAMIHLAANRFSLK